MRVSAREAAAEGIASIAALPLIRGQRILSRFVASDMLVLHAIPVCLALLFQTQAVAWAWIVGAMAVGFVTMAWAQRSRVIAAV